MKKLDGNDAEMSLQDITFEREYRSLSTDICRHFYIPALKEAVTYKRSVGFFSSSSLVEISIGLEQLVKNEGIIQLIASPKLSEEDLQAIDKGYEKREQIIEKCLLRELDKAKELKPYEEKSMAYLAALIALNILEIKIVVLSDSTGIGMYHEKLGLITDKYGNTVAFSGSMNETATGMKTNYETIDVYTSWSESKERVEDKIKAFDKLWNNSEEHIFVYEFPKLKDAIVKKYRKENTKSVRYDLTMGFDAYLAEREVEYQVGTIHLPSSIELRDYQIKAIDNWQTAGFRGIFDMATGTGKTITGLAAIVRLAEHLHDKLAIIIVVPYQHLVEQWVEDIEAFGLDPIIGYSGSKDREYKKRLKNKILDYNLEVIKNFCFICTNATFASKAIQSELSKVEKDMLLVIDEAHNAGADSISKCLSGNYQYRLALSATFDRHHDEEGTERLYQFFGKKAIEYTLEEAIRDKMLTEYYYYPIVIALTEEERGSYTELTREIGRCITKSKNGKIKLSKKGEMLAIKRSRIIAGASEKVERLIEIMQEYKDDDNMLIYCGAAQLTDEWEADDIGIRQIDLVTRRLGNELNMKVAKYTSNENIIERERRKRMFLEKDIQALIAIKCLDEGVNIPSVKTAFILASSTNKKEYIQRRGRVLRLAPDKLYARIYDFVCLPRTLEEMPEITADEIEQEKRLIINELNRVLEFKRLALNPYDSNELIDELVEIYQLYKEPELELYGE